MLRQAARALCGSSLMQSTPQSVVQACPHMCLMLAWRPPIEGAQVASCSGRQYEHQHQSARHWSSSGSLSTAAADAAPAEEGLLLDDTAVTRLKQLQQESPGEVVALRVEVEGGGCSGFQYIFKLDSNVTPEDMVFEKDGVKVVCDTVSLEFLKGAKVEFEESLMRSAFQIAANPNSEATCGCGSSFTAKM